ncbi:MAG: 2-oxo-tetronate isomerase [Alphaproteobacteria bacterium]|jgi:hydroxypyruvate isomerase
MPRLAANLTLLFNEVDFLDRFGAAAACGFQGVEFLFPYDRPAETIAARLVEYDLANALFNMSPGDWTAGDRGLAGIPGREAEFRETVAQALAYAKVLKTPTVHVMHGVPRPRTDPVAMRETFIENLRYAAGKAADIGVRLVIEPLNARDNPGYPLNRQRQARDIVLAVGAPNLFVQFDFYHCQIVEGDVTMAWREIAGAGRDGGLVGHVQIAGVPDRHEPDTGELDIGYVMKLIDSVGYQGWVGCEYRPANDTVSGLGWASSWGIEAKEA